MLRPCASTVTLHASGRAHVQHKQFIQVDDAPTRDHAVTVVGLSSAMIAETFRAMEVLSAHLVLERDLFAIAADQKREVTVATKHGEFRGRLAAWNTDEIELAAAETGAHTVVRRDELVAYTIANGAALFATPGLCAHFTVRETTPNVPRGLLVSYDTAALVARVEHSIVAATGVCTTTVVVTNTSGVAYENVSLEYVEAASDRRVEAITSRGEETAAAAPIVPPASRSRHILTVRPPLETLRVGVTRVHARELTLNAFRTVFVAKMQAAPSNVEEQRTAVRRASWKLREDAEFMFSGAVELGAGGGAGGAYWLDAWKHPTELWVDLDASDDVLVRRRVHTTSAQGAHTQRLLVRVEVYNRSAAAVNARVEEYVGDAFTAAAAQRYVYTGTARTPELRHAAVEQSFRADAVDTTVWRELSAVPFTRVTTEEDPRHRNLALGVLTADSLTLLTYELVVPA
jgi:hypothetical protein